MLDEIIEFPRPRLCGRRSLLQQQICSSSHIRDFFRFMFCSLLSAAEKKYLNELKMIYALQFRGIYEFFSFFLLLLLLLTLLRVSCSSSTLWRFRLFFVFFLFEYIKTFSSLLRVALEFPILCVLSSSLDCRDPGDFSRRSSACCVCSFSI